MKIQHFLICVIVTGIISCKKGNGDNPQIKLKSIGPSVVSRQDFFRVDLGFTNKNSDVNDTLFMQKHVLNLNQKGLSSEYRTDSFSIPSYPGTNKGDLQLIFARINNTGYPLLADPATAQNDTAIFSFSIKSTQNLMSDTVHSGIIVILSQ